MWFWYQEKEDNEVILLKIFGDQPVVTVPEKIQGRTVTELAPYCFSEKNNYTGREDFIRVSTDESDFFEQADIARKKELERALEQGIICELSGEYITEVILPAFLKKIGDLCFYQCRNLKSVSLSGFEVEIGSDAFMNCRKLDTFFIRAGAECRTGLRQILLQRTVATDVYFENASVHFPEFSEQYDLIGPAHIFELNIEGEGFRARQCFENGIFQFEQYDRIFSQASDVETEKTLCKMAALRLGKPFCLRDQYRKLYQKYLLEHLEGLCEEIIEKKDIQILQILSGQGILEDRHFDICLEKMLQAHWLQGTHALLSMRNAANK